VPKWETSSVSMLCALERNEDIPGPAFCLERGGPALLQVRRVVAGYQRVAVHNIDSLPHLPLKGVLFCWKSMVAGFVLGFIWTVPA
jgi:hypothetical protein